MDDGLGPAPVARQAVGDADERADQRGDQPSDLQVVERDGADQRVEPAERYTEQRDEFGAAVDDADDAGQQHGPEVGARNLEEKTPWTSESVTSTMAMGYSADSTGTDILMMVLRPALETRKLNAAKMALQTR